jgi:hypothetical protein
LDVEVSETAKTLFLDVISIAAHSAAVRLGKAKDHCFVRYPIRKEASHYPVMQPSRTVARIFLPSNPMPFVLHQRRMLQVPDTIGHYWNLSPGRSRRRIEGHGGNGSESSLHGGGQSSQRGGDPIETFAT